MEVFLNIMTCIFEVTIFELFFRGLLRRRYSSPIFYIAIYIGVVSLIYGINSLGNSKLNLIANILIYYAVYSLLYEEELKERVFYFTVFFTTFAGVEILCEFVLSLILGEGYSWENQSHLARFIVICLEKLITFVTLFIIKKKLNKQKYGIKNEILLYSLVLPIATFGIYSALLYSGLMVEVSGINEGILLVGCILLLFANAIIFFLYEYIFRLNYENQALEMLTLKTDLEKKYYDRMEKVNLEQSNYMHDLKFMLRTIGNLAAQDQNEEITSVIQNMKIRIGEMEEEFFCKNKVLNTILCEKKKEAIDNKINYQAYVEPGIPLDFIQDIDIIIIMGNIIDNAIEATKKIDYGYIDINVFATQKGHIEDIRNGELSMKSINRLMDALEELKQDKRYEMLKIELTTEELDVLVNRIYEYTVKLASDNAVELTDDEKKSSDNSILNLQRYLKTQKRIFKSVA